MSHLRPAIRHLSLERMLVWTYRQQQADRMSGLSLHVPDAPKEDFHLTAEPATSGCGCVQMQEIALLGALIPSTAGQQCPRLHPDAEKLHEAVVALSAGPHWMGAALLQRYGYLGQAPDWGQGVVPQYEPVWESLTSRRPVQNRWDESSRVKGRIAKHFYCPVQLYPSPEWLELCRAEYATWYAALQALFQQVRTHSFALHCLTHIGPSAQPWMDDAEPQGRSSTGRY